MQLSNDQIQALFRFTEKKSVWWYDLQLELVDHLASSIEDEMTADHKLPFDAALARVYARFGIFGFATLVREKGEQLQKAAGKVWWSEIRRFFGWPQVIGVVALLAGSWQLAQWVPAPIMLILLSLVYVTALVITFRARKRWKPRLPLMLFSAGSYYQPTALIFFDMIIYSAFTNYSAGRFCIMVALVVAVRVASYRVMQHIHQQAKSRYPAAFA